MFSSYFMYSLTHTLYSVHIGASSWRDGLVVVRILLFNAYVSQWFTFGTFWCLWIAEHCIWAPSWIMSGWPCIHAGCAHQINSIESHWSFSNANLRRKKLPFLYLGFKHLLFSFCSWWCINNDLDLWHITTIAYLYFSFTKCNWK